MDIVTEFNSAIKNRLKRGQIKTQKSNLNSDIEQLIKDSNIDIQLYIQDFIKNMESIEIINNERIAEILTHSSLRILDNRHLQFCTLNKDNKICFDLTSLNDANQCNIVNYNNKYVITKSIESFLTNKVWAWIDRGRNIWDTELY